MPRIDAKALAKRIRIHAVEMTAAGNSSHVGSVLSVADILAALYGGVVDVRPDDPEWADRDRVILSKGHAGAGLYAALAESGFIERAVLASHCADGSRLSGHVSHKGVPGVEFSTGSLGHGLGVAAGMAYAQKLRQTNARCFCVMSDGECDEGSVWEAALFAAHAKLNNLIAVIDYNKIQSLGPVADTLALEPFADKWRAFGWAVEEVDGHEIDRLQQVMGASRAQDAQPLVVIAHTTKGKGVSFMENSVLWHYRSPQGEFLTQALQELTTA